MSTSRLLPSVDKVDIAAALGVLLSCPAFLEGLDLQARTIDRFHRLAAEVAGPTCPVLAPPAEAMGIERNFFSTFFLAVTRQLVGPSRFMPLYAMVNQGMRAWVTACDNILDDEYKAVFQLPPSAESRAYGRWIPIDPSRSSPRKPNRSTRDRSSRIGWQEGWAMRKCI